MKVLRKVENLIECHHNFGKGSGTKGKGKMHKGPGFQPERGEQRKFGGYCNWCWRNRSRRKPSVGLNKST